MLTFTRLIPVVCFGAALTCSGCGRKDTKPIPSSTGGSTSATTQTHDDHDHDHTHGDDHGHDEERPLGTTTIDGMSIKCWQGHGQARAGKEMHLVVKLPYSDSGATIVRAWIGTADRLSSMVAKAEYAPSDDDYDVHAIAPDPLPADAQWWIEVEKPDGSNGTSSISLLR